MDWMNSQGSIMNHQTSASLSNLIRILLARTCTMSLTLAFGLKVAVGLPARVQSSDVLVTTFSRCRAHLKFPMPACAAQLQSPYHAATEPTLAFLPGVGTSASLEKLTKDSMIQLSCKTGNHCSAGWRQTCASNQLRNTLSTEPMISFTGPAALLGIMCIDLD